MPFGEVGPGMRMAVPPVDPPISSPSKVIGLINPVVGACHVPAVGLVAVKTLPEAGAPVITTPLIAKLAIAPVLLKVESPLTVTGA